jgi:transposase
VRSKRVWKRLLGVEHTVVEQVLFDEERGAVVAVVRPTRSRRRRCGICQRRCPGYDQGEGCRRWRTLDLGTVQAFLEADAPRVACPQHGVVTAGVPWARHGAGFTRGFEDTCAWLAVHTSRAAVAELLGVAWRTVGRVCARVAAEHATQIDLLDGLRRIGIDEISYKKGQRYLTVVVDHDSGRLVWAAPGANEATLERFFDASASSAAQGSSWSPRTPRSGLLVLSSAVAQPRSAAPTRSTSSSGRPTRSTRSAVRSGTSPARTATPCWRGSSRVPGSHCGRTPRA